MNKKDRKAEKILAEAREYSARVIKESVVANRRPIKVVQKPTPKKEVKVEAPKFNENEKYDSFTIEKRGKGEFYVTAYKGGQRVVVPNRFKSKTKAEEWTDRHSM